MLKFIIRRILSAIPTMLVLITVSFFMMRLAPGSPFTGDKNVPPAVLANIEAKYHLNDPMYLQYFNYLKQLAHGDLGPSFKYKDYNVNELLAQALPVYVELGVGRAPPPPPGTARPRGFVNRAQDLRWTPLRVYPVHRRAQEKDRLSGIPRAAGRTAHARDCRESDRVQGCRDRRV